MRGQCFFDYTCGYSFRVWRWLEEQVLPEHPGLEIEWSPFSLKEVNRTEGASAFEPGERPSLSVLALALGVATKAMHGDFAAYHSAAFAAFHGGGSRVTPEDLAEIAATACRGSGDPSDAPARWIEAVAASHRNAIARWGVFGTPTLVLDGAAVYLKMAEVPATTADGITLWRALETLVVSHPDLVEIKRPVAPPPSS